jgi:hypothetical protein
MCGVWIESFQENILRKGNDSGGNASDDAVGVSKVVRCGRELLSDSGDGLCGGIGAGAGRKSGRTELPAVRSRAV